MQQQKKTTMIEKQIQLLSKQIYKLEKKDFDLDAWKATTNVILEKIFGANNQGIKAIDKIKFDSVTWSIRDTSHFWNNMSFCKKQAKAIIEACINNLSKFGEPKNNSAEKSDNNINHTQDQNQTDHINIITSAVKHELTVSQLKELDELRKVDETKSVIKTKIINKLRSFGSDASSKILATILTNPKI